ncbi:MAG: GNAT family N-acetyltransferase [Deltaproteobacteria bacterium]|nr:GNAT family N-acetyltransferase [Deltaproteobacteria bacterium]
MFVVRDRRGAGIGIGGLVVGALEAWGRELGYRRAVLETGNRQPEAVRLYERCGFASAAPNSSLMIRAR